MLHLFPRGGPGYSTPSAHHKRWRLQVKSWWKKVCALLWTVFLFASGEGLSPALAPPPSPPLSLMQALGSQPWGIWGPHAGSPCRSTVAPTFILNVSLSLMELKFCSGRSCMVRAGQGTHYRWAKSEQPTPAGSKMSLREEAVILCPLHFIPSNYTYSCVSQLWIPLPSSKSLPFATGI